MQNTRTLIAIDLENILGGANPTKHQLSALDRELARLRHPQHQVVIAASHHLALQVGWRAPWARWKWRSGPDGADLALLDVLRTERVAERFENVVLASGDGIFAEALAELAHDGVHTTAVSAEHQLSRRLRLAAHTVVLLGAEQESTLDAA